MIGFDRMEQLFALDVKHIVESFRNILNIWVGEHLKRLHLSGSTNERKQQTREATGK